MLDAIAIWLIVGIVVAEITYQFTKRKRPNLRRKRDYALVVILWPLFIANAVYTAFQR
jgi:hypothetical protein